MYAEALGPTDLRAIASKLHPRLPPSTLDRMIALLALMSAAAAGASMSPLGSSQAAGGRHSAATAAVNASGNGGGAISGSVTASTTGSGSGARFAAQGGPWEFNLRDLLRWADLTEGAVAETDAQQQQQQQGQTGMQEREPHSLACSEQGSVHTRLDEAAEHFAHTLFVQRLRTAEDRVKFGVLFARAWGRPLAVPGRVQVGVVCVCVVMCV